MNVEIKDVQRWSKNVSDAPAHSASIHIYIIIIIFFIIIIMIIIIIIII